jgi:subtilisin family serine protease
VPIYILRSRAGLPVSQMLLGPRKLALEPRKKQIAEVLDINNRDATQLLIRQWLKEHQKTSQVRPIMGLRSPSVLGLQIVEMTPQEAELFDKDVPSAQATLDRRVDLIHPMKVEQNAGNEDPNSPAGIFRRYWRSRVLDGLSESDGSGVTVAVLDTGVDGTHPDFGLEGDLTGFTFDLSSGEAIPQTPVVDTGTHGTHVAGILAGAETGMAPEATLVSGVVLPGGTGSIAMILIALQWAASRPDIQIVNLSAGIRGYNPELKDAIDALHACGLFTVAAIGNEGPNVTCSPGNYPQVMSVGSILQREYDFYRESAFSSRGEIMADQHLYRVPRAYAPGEQVRSCSPGGGYAIMTGTSMAAPMVAGLAARILQANPAVTLTELTNDIESRCNLLGLYRDHSPRFIEEFLHRLLCRW